MLSDDVPEVSALRTRALFAKGVLHLRRADLEPVTGVAHAIIEAARGLGDEAAAIALDQESIFMLMTHDWAGATRQSVAALARAGSPPAIAVCTRATSRPSWRWRSVRRTTPGRGCTRR